MLDGLTHASEVPPVPVQIPAEGDHGPHHTPLPRQRPSLLAFQALANLFASWPALPDLELSIHASGTIVGRVAGTLPPGEAEAVLHAWREALSSDPGMALSDLERVDGPFYWNQLAAQLPVHPTAGQVLQVAIIVMGRKWALPRPLYAAGPSALGRRR